MRNLLNRLIESVMVSLLIRIHFLCYLLMVCYYVCYHCREATTDIYLYSSISDKSRCSHFSIPIGYYSLQTEISRKLIVEAT